MITPYKMLAFIGAFFILYFSLMPIAPGSGTGGLPYMDKIVHVFSYFVFAFLIFKGFRDDFRKTIVFGFPMVYGGFMEILQMFVVGRGADLFDFFANILGISFVVIYAIYFEGLVDLRKSIDRSVA